MSNAEYQNHRKIAAVVSKSLTNLLNQSEYSRPDVIDHLAEKTGLQAQSLGPAVTSYLGVTFAAQISPALKKDFINHDENMRRISLTCAYLGVEPQDKIITDIKKINANFVYPPLSPLPKEEPINEEL